jgi:hypothetical protein
MNILRRSLRAHTPVLFLPLTPALLFFINTNNPMFRLYQTVLVCAWCSCLQIRVLKNPMKGGERSFASWSF